MELLLRSRQRKHSFQHPNDSSKTKSSWTSFHGLFSSCFGDLRFVRSFCHSWKRALQAYEVRCFAGRDASTMLCRNAIHQGLPALVILGAGLQLGPSFHGVCRGKHCVDPTTVGSRIQENMLATKVRCLAQSRSFVPSVNLNI